MVAGQIRASAFLEGFTNRLPARGRVANLVFMTETLRIRILDTLDALERPGAPASAMGSALRELDRIVADASAPLPGDLRHYLSRRSYAKARIFLAGSGPVPPGDCGRGSSV